MLRRLGGSNRGHLHQGPQARPVRATAPACPSARSAGSRREAAPDRTPWPALPARDPPLGVRAAQSLGELEHHPRRAQVGRVRGPSAGSRMDDRAGGKLGTGAVVIGDHHVQACAARCRHLLHGGDSAVDGHEQRHLAPPAVRPPRWTTRSPRRSGWAAPTPAPRPGRAACAPASPWSRHRRRRSRRRRRSAIRGRRARISSQASGTPAARAGRGAPPRRGTSVPPRRRGSLSVRAPSPPRVIPPARRPAPRRERPRRGSHAQRVGRGCIRGILRGRADRTSAFAPRARRDLR